MRLEDFFKECEDCFYAISFKGNKKVPILTDISNSEEYSIGNYTISLLNPPEDRIGLIRPPSEEEQWNSITIEDNTKEQAYSVHRWYSQVYVKGDLLPVLSLQEINEMKKRGIPRVSFYDLSLSSSIESKIRQYNDLREVYFNKKSTVDPGQRRSYFQYEIVEEDDNLTEADKRRKETEEKLWKK